MIMRTPPKLLDNGGPSTANGTTGTSPALYKTSDLYFGFCDTDNVLSNSHTDSSTRPKDADAGEGLTQSAPDASSTPIDKRPTLQDLGLDTSFSDSSMDTSTKSEVPRKSPIKNQFMKDNAKKRGREEGSPDRLLKKHHKGQKENPGKGKKPASAPATKLPPIVLSNKDYFPALEKQVLRSLRFKSVYRAVGKGRQLFIQTDNLSDYKQIEQAVNSRNIGYHTHRLPSEKTKRYVIKGLITTTDTAEVVEVLEEQGHKINNHLWKTRKINGETVKLPILIIEVALAKNTSDIMNIPAILNQIVSIEEELYSGPPICKKCLAFKHSHNRCHEAHSFCAHCAGKHTTSDCNKLETTPFCKNCKKSGHRATYKGCPTYRKFCGLDNKADTSSVSTEVFVEAPIPTTNPWKKVTPTPQPEEEGGQ